LKKLVVCLVGDLVGLECALDTVGLRLILPPAAELEDHVLPFGGLVTGLSSSFLDFRRNGLLEKKPDRFFCTDFSGEPIPGSSTPFIGPILVGEGAADIGSALVNELGTEYWLSLSLLSGLVFDDKAEPATEGGASARQNIVMPSVGYWL
jgi:hypothetical protein